MNKKTLVIGASPNPMRYSHRAVVALQWNEVPVIALGIRKGEIRGTPIELEKKPFENIHTISLYVGPERQQEYIDYVLELKPRRLIFNPGTINDDFIARAEAAGIETVVNCTLEMLSNDEF